MTELFNVGVVGTGYVGLTTGACLAHIGHRVTCVDKNAHLATELGENRMPFYEPGLEELVEGGVRQGRLRFSTDLAPVVQRAEVVFIAVDTPQREGGSADLTSVANVALAIGRVLSEVRTDRERPLVVGNKSTVPVGSGDYVSMLLREGAEDGGLSRRLEPRSRRLEPRVLYEKGAQSTIVCFQTGSWSGRTIAMHSIPCECCVNPIEQSFPTELDPRPKVAVPFVTTNLVSAEMIKYAANAFLATKVSFTNEMVNLCELVGADVSEVSAELLQDISGKDLPPEHGPAKPGEQLRSSVDPALAGRVMRWRPEVDLADGLGETLRFFGVR